MMDFIMVPAIMAIITLGIYKLFELFVCKKERLLIIEKMGEKLLPEMLEHKIKLSLASLPNISFSGLKWGCLLLGFGFGMLLAHQICWSTLPGYMQDLSYELRSYIGLVYGGSILFGGGLGLLVAFVIELWIQKRKKE
ncbi:hypothetical protein [Phocaeicola sp.]|uniref:hypothetical protein n=1 Tax=Phocaeicola sp. TaxID=2773926 RepID=UPI0023CAAB5F|nr:hypothetical protein [Phocaeicola sp.]MDE5678242.1 hypothetical protein [Phocaeicola sp.]